MSPHWGSYGPILVKYLKPQQGKVYLLFGLLLVSTLLQLTNPQIMAAFINGATGGAAMPTLLRLALLFLGVALLGYLIKLATTYVSETVGWTATNALRADLTRHCLDLDMSFHNHHPPGELIERVDGDVSQLAHFFAQLAVQVLGQLLLMAGILVVLFWEAWRIGLAFTLFAAVALLILLALRNFATQQLKDEREAYAALFGFLEERLGGLEDLCANGAGHYTLYQLLGYMRTLWRKSRQAAGRSAIFGSLIVVWFSVGTTLALAVGAFLFQRQVIAIGTVFLLYQYVDMLENPLMLLTQELQNLQEASGSLLRIEELYNTKRTISDGAGAVLAAGALAVEFADVSFTYRAKLAETVTDETSTKALHDFSLRLSPGCKLGLLGRTGSGKTTLARLLLRLYEPQHGVIRLGGSDIRDLRLADLRQRVGVVTQDVQLFQATVRDNLTFFDPTIPDAQIVAVLKDVGLGHWFAALPQGLDTLLETGGLSAGEAQLLAFARVFLKDPGLVILDEASSRLDPATEQLIERAVDKLLENRTAIVIAHRLATVQRVDEIVILENGRIQEAGSRVQLAATPTSRFAQLLQTGLESVMSDK
ncbi:MAG: ABC transporter ATP-binding protein [Caldilineaceae bacterium]